MTPTPSVIQVAPAPDGISTYTMEQLPGRSQSTTDEIDDSDFTKQDEADASSDMEVKRITGKLYLRNIMSIGFLCVKFWF